MLKNFVFASKVTVTVEELDDEDFDDPPVLGN
jgi:hypothetical protein